MHYYLQAKNNQGWVLKQILASVEQSCILNYYSARTGTESMNNIKGKNAQTGKHFKFKRTSNNPLKSRW